MPGQLPTDVLIKSFKAEIVATDDALGIVDAIVAVTGNVDDGTERIQAGAFKKTLTEFAGRVRVVDNHNHDSIFAVIGMPVEMKEIDRAELKTLAPDIAARFPGATGGLFTRTQYLLDTPEGKGAYVRLKSGAVAEYSIAFNAFDITMTKEEIDGQEAVIKNIGTIKLWEYGPVVWGMNPATTTVAVKQNGDEIDDELPPVEDEKQDDPEPITIGEFSADVVRNEIGWAVNWILFALERAEILTDENKEEIASTLAVATGDAADAFRAAMGELGDQPLIVEPEPEEFSKFMKERFDVTDDAEATGPEGDATPQPPIEDDETPSPEPTDAALTEARRQLALARHAAAM